ncbi:MAG TPA: efflux RND transporter periplasmic adaptor subunit [Steroidobacteraceae bacterium]|nr:efflux RND transporter periplasmic adaptor subunit [Steroidobacteraceae bacterium]
MANQHTNPAVLSTEEDSSADRSNRIATFPTRNAHEAPIDAPNAPVRSKGKLIGIVVALVAAVVIGWLVMNKPAAQPTPTPAEAQPIELASIDLASVELRALSRSLPLSGSIAPVVQATVKAKVSGQVEAMTVREGQDVAEGDVIARIETDNLQAEYDREMAAVDKARADLQLATLNRDKNRTLLEQRYISQNTFDATESAWAGSVAQLKLAEAQARLAKIALDDAVIRAPFAGTIARRLVQPGEKVSPDSSVVTLVDLRQMLLEAAVPASEIPSVRTGQTARFRVGGFGDRTFEGKVQRINPITAEGSRAITIYVAVPNQDRALKGGMFAQGELTLEATDPVLSVPRAAVHEEAGVPFVYTFAQGKINRVPVKLGLQADGATYVQIVDGLKQGQRVITADIGDRKSGTEAKVRGAEKVTSG